MLDLVRGLDGVVAAEAAKVFRTPTLANSFPRQWAYVTSTAPLNAVACSRRAGKSVGAQLRHVIKALTAPKGTWSHAGSLIRRNAKKHFWKPVKTWLDYFGCTYHADNTEMILETERGTFFQAFGCDDEAGTKAVQGDGSALFTIDECHLPNDNVLQLLVDVATPMLTDFDGALDLLGLVPETDGIFYRALNQLDEDGMPLEEEGYRVFGWHQFDHDFPRSREDKLETVIKRVKKQGYKLDVITTIGADGRPAYSYGKETSPAVAHQYFGSHDIDPSKRAYEFEYGRNDYDPTLRNEHGNLVYDFDRPVYRTGWGIDTGYNDNDALVIGSRDMNDSERRILVRWWWQHNQLDMFKLADLLRVVRRVLPPAVVVADQASSGSGKKGMETISTVLGVKLETKPGDVMVSVRLMNDDFRSARLLLPTVDLITPKIRAEAAIIFAKEPERLEMVLQLLDEGTVDLRKELGRVTKRRNPRTRKWEINKSGHHSDVSEAARYFHSGMTRGPSAPEEGERPEEHETVLERRLRRARLTATRNKSSWK